MKARTWFTVLTAAALVMTSSGVWRSGIGKAEQGGNPVNSTSAVASGQTGGVIAAENEQLALHFYPDTAEITVTVKATGSTWYSNPVDRLEDPIAKGAKLQDLHAQLLLDYVDPLNKPFQLNNFTGSIGEGAFTWKEIKNGIEVSFDFPKAEITVPVQYLLHGDALSASIVAERIEQRGKFRLVNVGLLPFFGAGNMDDHGYLFIPDGSGALIRFNNNNSIYRNYNERVYGGDQAIETSEQSRFAETIRLPVYGIKKNDKGFLAVIHQGAYQAGITATGSQKNNQYNAVYSYLNMLEFETNTLMAGSLNEKQVVRGSQSAVGIPTYEVRYYFLDGEKADYSGMATRYRQYLIEEQGVKGAIRKKEDQIPVLLDLVGGVMRRKTFLGVPYRSIELLTSHEDIRTITSQLMDQGIRNLDIRYESWMDGGSMDQMAVSVDSESKLGGDRSFKKLTVDLEEQNVRFYPVVDPVRLYKNGNGFNKFWDATKSISRAPVLKNDFLLSTGMKNKTLPFWYLLKPESAKEALERFTQSAHKAGLKHTAIQSMGSIVYSDFRRQMLTKNQTGRLWEEGLAQANANIPSLSYDRANAYTFPYADNLTYVPLGSSEFDLSDETIPFYSMAISGLIPAYSEPVNLAGSPNQYLLKLLETGTYPTYRLIGRDGGRLIGTNYDSLYSSEFNLWSGDIVEQYNRLNDALLPVMGQTITRHEKLQNGVYRTTYRNGKTVIVNYTEETVKVGQDQIGPNGYRVR